MKVMKSATKELCVCDENSFEKYENIFRQTSEITKKYFRQTLKSTKIFSANFEKNEICFRQHSKKNENIFGRVRNSAEFENMKIFSSNFEKKIFMPFIRT